VDPTTGGVTLRAIFPNPEELLLPGMSVRATVVEGVDPNAILAPQQGIVRDTKGDPTAWVVASDNKVELRNLKVSRTVGNNWLVSDGLKDGDRVIVEGTQKAHPGVVVSPVLADLDHPQPTGTDKSQPGR
jgi:membrane fusion protein, multidrug efflux system